MKKYIKELGDLKRDLDVFFTDGHFEAKDAIDYAIKCIRKFENNTNWINVEDSLPEKADWYNVYTRDIVTMLFFDCSVEFKPCWLTIDGDWNDKVTYWQTLPLKPLQIKGSQ